MKIFKAIHISKKWIGGIALAGLLAASAIFSFPPAVAKVANIISASAERKLPIYCVQTDEPKISVSFDAAWGADDTDELLRILEENDVKATFFLCGYWVDKYPEEVKKIAEAGHDLGNHSMTHPHMSQLSSEQIAKELQECHQRVKNLTGIEMDLFRPPFGEYDNHVIETAQINGYSILQWDIDTHDTKRKTDFAILESIFIIISSSSNQYNKKWSLHFLQQPLQLFPFRKYFLSHIHLSPTISPFPPSSDSA